MEEKVAIKSGLYFEIFDKTELPNSLIKSPIKVELNKKVYDLYKATNWDDEKVIDEMFGERLGHYIDDHIWKPKCVLIGEDGNIFNLMGKASRTLKENKMQDRAKEMVDRVTSCHSYPEALNIIGEYVDITNKEQSTEEEFE